MKRPRVITKCVASAFQSSNERIIEFSFPGTEDGKGGGPLGGLISFRNVDGKARAALAKAKGDA